MKQQRSSQVKPLKTILSDSQNKFMIILMNWKNIVGRANAKLMMPLELKQKILVVALPNNIVLAAASRFTELMIKRSDFCSGGESVKKIKFVIQPSLFKTKKSAPAKEKTDLPEISEEEIAQKKQELIERFSLEENIAETAAKIELFNIKRGEND